MSAPLLQGESLIWGVLSFAGPPLDAEVNFEIAAMSDGTHFGNPGPIIETVQSLLIDGSLAAVTGWENREIPIRLRISANDGEALGQAEAALLQQALMDQPYPLIWTSPVGLSQTCVFDVVVARLERDTDEGWDVEEVFRGHRYFLLTLTCLPFARAMDSVTIPAVPAPPIDPGTPATSTDIDGCASVTPIGTYAGTWTMETSGTVPTGPNAVTVSGETAIEATSRIRFPSQYLRLIRHFDTPLVVLAGEFLAVDVTSEHAYHHPAATGVWKIHDGTAYLDPVAIANGGGEGGSDRLYFDNVAASVSDLKVLYDWTVRPSVPFPDAANTATLRVFHVAVTNRIGDDATTTSRQRTRLLQVEGSAPTQAALRLFDDTGQNLGDDVIVYTGTNTNWQPPLRRWLQPGPVVTASATRVSGGFHNLATPSVFRIPARLFTTGTYALMARVRCTGAETIGYSVRVVDNAGAATIGSGQIQSGSIALPDDAGSYHVRAIAALTLPPVEVETDDYSVELTLTGTADIEFDEGWLFGLHDGALTWIQTTDDFEWIEIRSPELGAARPSVWAGTGAVGELSACIDYQCLSFGSHRFAPGPMQVQTVTDDSWKSQCEMEYFPRFGWHPSSPETTS